jgi:hypothetical protein
MATLTKVTQTDALIDAVLTDMTNYGKDWEIALAGAIQRVDHSTPNGRMGTLYVRLYNDRKAAGKDNYTGIKPESIPSFIQKLQNKVTGKFVTMSEKLGDSIDWDSKTAGGTGTDAFAEYCDRLSISPISRKNWDALHTATYEKLEELHSVLRRTQSYMPTEPLFTYSSDKPDEQDPSIWLPHHRTEGYDDAIAAATLVREEAEARNDENMLSDILLAA